MQFTPNRASVFGSRQIDLKTSFCSNRDKCLFLLASLRQALAAKHSAAAKQSNHDQNREAQVAQLCLIVALRIAENFKRMRV
jgi:hypothetical protein